MAKRKSEDAGDSAPPAEPSRRSARIKSNASSNPAPTPPAKKAKKATEPKVPKEEANNKGDAEEKEEKEPEPEVAKLEVGGVVADIKLKNEKDEEVEVKTLAGDKKGFVIFTYPKAATPGCTNQACGFRDKYTEFSDLGYEVYGLSKDTPSAQSKWKESKQLQYSLLSDPSASLLKTLGAYKGGKIVRSHFVFDKEGNLLEADLGVKPATDSENALKFVKDL